MIVTLVANDGNAGNAGNDGRQLRGCSAGRCHRECIQLTEPQHCPP